MSTKVERPLSYWLRHQREKCDCGGYHFPHRRGSGACHYSSRADYYAAVRAGLPAEECQQLLSAADLRRMFPHEEDT